MAYRDHNRHMTDEQFAEGTTIDGDRLDTAMRQVAEGFNKVPKGDIGTRFVPNTYVLGYSPPLDPVRFAGSTLTHHWPWLDHANDAQTLEGNAPDDYLNRLREKGYETPGIVSPPDPTAGRPATGGTHWIWTTSLAFHKPVVVRKLHVSLEVDHTSLGASAWFLNTFSHGVTPPPNLTGGADAQDFAISMHVADLSMAEDRQFDSQEILRRAFRLHRETIWQLDTATPGTVRQWPLSPNFNDLTVEYPGLSPAGAWIEMDVNVPIHADSRIHFGLIMPEYDGVTVGTVPWGVNPWYCQYYHVSMTVLEEVE